MAFGIVQGRWLSFTWSGVLMTARVTLFMRLLIAIHTRGNKISSLLFVRLYCFVPREKEGTAIFIINLTRPYLVKPCEDNVACISRGLMRFTSRF